MIRKILNFEAVAHTEGLDPDTGQQGYVVDLMLNGHPVRHWVVSNEAGILMSQNERMLEQFVAHKMWGLFHALERGA